MEWHGCCPLKTCFPTLRRGHANKVCRHTILTTLSNELFDVFYAYKEAKVIWESMLIKYTTEDVGKQKFVVGNYYKWEVVDNKDIKL